MKYLLILELKLLNCERLTKIAFTLCHLEDKHFTKHYKVKNSKKAQIM